MSGAIGTRGVDTIYTVYLCQTMSDNEFENQDELDRRSETDDDSDTDSVAELEYNTWNDACTWEFRSESGNDSPGLFQNPPTDIIQNIYRQSETDDDSDTDSATEFEYDTWKDACAWEFQSTSGHDSPGLIQNPPTDIIQKIVRMMMNIRRNWEMGDVFDCSNGSRHDIASMSPLSRDTPGAECSR